MESLMALCETYPLMTQFSTEQKAIVAMKVLESKDSIKRFVSYCTGCKCYHIHLK